MDNILISKFKIPSCLEGLSIRKIFYHRDYLLRSSGINWADCPTGQEVLDNVVDGLRSEGEMGVRYFITLLQILSLGIAQTLKNEIVEFRRGHRRHFSDSSISNYS